MQVIILAGGEGKRMNSSIPKVCHSVRSPEDGQMYPMINLILKTVSKLNPSKILVVVGKHMDTIRDTIGPNPRIEYVLQTEALGTGHAVKCCLPYLQHRNEVSVIPTLILSGDVPFISVDTLQRMAKTPNSVLITELDNPFGCGRIELDINGRVANIIEQKDCNKSEAQIKLVNCGIYNIDSDVLQECIPLLSNDNKANEYYLTDIVKIYKSQSSNCVSFMPVELENDRIHEIQNINTQIDLIRANAKYKVGMKFCNNNLVGREQSSIREILFTVSSPKTGETEYMMNSSVPGRIEDSTALGDTPCLISESDLDLYYTQIT